MTPTELPLVWIVDDDDDDQYFLQYAFKQALPHIKTRVLTDGLELITALEQETILPKLVLLDLNMPRKDGFEALQELRSIPDYQHLPVVVLTTSNRQEDKSKALQLGADDFMTKAAIQKEILQMIKQLAVDWQLNE
ncbi:response regulator [Fibrella sp. HMF5405]|uniref:Response regulator n=1 Tax=Fibrella forsythiae TaxID=2817061 RepID=A0ABS3JSD1_9BACT|nr:response regulator [Fibrella forsythiae]